MNRYTRFGGPNTTDFIERKQKNRYTLNGMNFGKPRKHRSTLYCSRIMCGTSNKQKQSPQKCSDGRCSTSPKVLVNSQCSECTKKNVKTASPQLWRHHNWNYVFVFAGLRLNNAWASGTVLRRPFLQPESPLSSQDFGLRLQVQASGFELTTPILEAARSNH